MVGRKEDLLLAGSERAVFDWTLRYREPYSTYVIIHAWAILQAVVVQSRWYIKSSFEPLVRRLCRHIKLLRLVSLLKQKCRLRPRWRLFAGPCHSAPQVWYHSEGCRLVYFANSALTDTRGLPHINNIEQATQLLEVFQRHGHDELDSARAYGEGTTEELLGDLKWQQRGLKSEQVVMAWYPSLANQSQSQWTQNYSHRQDTRQRKAAGTITPRRMCTAGYWTA